MEISGSRLANRSSSIRHWRLKWGESGGGRCDAVQPAGAQPDAEQRIDGRRIAPLGNTRLARPCLGSGDGPSAGTC
jgi:hypothetical protein